MPAYDHHFLPLSPPLQGEEHTELESRGTINCLVPTGQELQARFLCLHEQVRVIAVTIPEAAAAHPDQFKWLKQIMDTAISALRLTVAPETIPIYSGDGFLNVMYQSDDPEPSFFIQMVTQVNPGYRLNINQVRDVFHRIANKNVGPIASLLAESLVSYIPSHYRVLSLCRAIELLYPDEQHADAALDAFQEQFAALEISNGRFCNILRRLRARCAHGKSSDRRVIEPFTGIGYNQPDLIGLLGLLRSVVIAGLASLTPTP